jgi:hypothetical protein
MEFSLMRLSRFSLLAALLLGAVGCKEADLAPVVAKIPPLAFVRYINAVPDTLNTTVRWIDKVEFTPQTFTNVPFRGMGQGGYQGLEAGARTLRVFTYDPNLNSSTNGLGAETKQLTELTHTFEAGKYYTLLHLGYARTGSTPAQRVLVIEDQLPAASTSVSIRAIHAGLGIANVDLHATAATTTSLVGSTPAFANVGLTNGTTGISAYASRATGAFAIQAAAAGTTTSLVAAAAPAGVAGTTTADPIAGATVAGSVMTAIAFPATVTGSRAAAFATPGIVFYLDRQPPRTTP